MVLEIIAKSKTMVKATQPINPTKEYKKKFTTKIKVERKKVNTEACQC